MGIEYCTKIGKIRVRDSAPLIGFLAQFISISAGLAINHLSIDVREESEASMASLNSSFIENANLSRSLEQELQNKVSFGAILIRNLFIQYLVFETSCFAQGAQAA